MKSDQTLKEQLKYFLIKFMYVFTSWFSVSLLWARVDIQWMIQHMLFKSLALCLPLKFRSIGYSRFLKQDFLWILTMRLIFDICSLENEGGLNHINEGSCTIKKHRALVKNQQTKVKVWRCRTCERTTADWNRIIDLAFPCLA